MKVGCSPQQKNSYTCDVSNFSMVMLRWKKNPGEILWAFEEYVTVYTLHLSDGHKRQFIHVLIDCAATS